MNRPWTRPIHRLAYRLNRLGWWLEDPGRKRRKRKAVADQIDGSIAPEGSDG